MALTQISTGGIKDDAVTDAKLPANSVGNSEMKDDAVGVAELSATGTASSSTFLRGDNSWVSAGTALSTSTNNQITTVTGANAITGEANLTYDGTNLQLNTDAHNEGFVIQASGSTYPSILGNAPRTGADEYLLRVGGKWDDTHVADVIFETGADTTNKDDGLISFWTASAGTTAERLRISSDGKFGFNTTDTSGNQRVTIKQTSHDTPLFLLTDQSNCYMGLGNSAATNGYIGFESTTLTFHNSGKKAEIDTSGNLKINDGNLVIGTSGHGIDFHNYATSGNPNSNLLDDYEEGSFDANFKFGGGAANISHAQYEGKYTKIGRLVTCSFVIGLSSKGTSTGNASINALPFTSTNDSGDRMGGYVTFYGGMSSVTSQISLYNTTNTTLVYLYDSTSTVNTVLTDSNFTDGTHMRGVIQYHCA